MSKSPAQRRAQTLHGNTAARAARLPPIALKRESFEQTLHELRVHQVELESQNEELRRAQLEIEATRDRYLDLYEFAPVSYLTLAQRGEIVEANLTACTLLGTERSKLLKQGFAAFVAGADASRWRRHFSDLQRDAQRRRIEVDLCGHGGDLIHAHLDCLPLSDITQRGPTYRISIVEDVTAYRREIADLRDDAARSTALSKRLLQAQEEERHRVARELHDELGQVLTVVDMALAPLARATPAGEDRRQLDEASRVVRQAIRQVRSIWTTLRMPMVTDFSLTDALRAMLEQHERRTGMATDFRCEGEFSGTAPVLGETLYRVAQEALANAARHSQASEIALSLVDGGDEISLRIRDNGVGFDTATPFGRAHLGVVGMRERVHLVEGQFEIASTPGRGTTVMVALPTGRASA